MDKQLTISDYKECWYVPGATTIIDLIHPETGLTLHFKKDEATVAELHPGAQRMDFDDACKAITAAEIVKYVKPVSEVTAADYNYALEVLPPGDWRSARGVSSFKMIERTAGSITQIFAQCGDRYFTLSDQYSTPAEEIAERVGAYIAEHPVADPQQWFTR